MRREVTPVFVSLVLFGAAYSVRAGSFEIIGSGQDFGPTALSEDGSTLVGSGEDASGNVQGMLWTQAGGTSLLGTPAAYPGGATAVSGNGSVVVGYYQNPSTFTYTGWEWTAGGGYQNISVPGYSFSLPEAITPDGSTVGLVAYNSTGPIEVYLDNTSTGLSLIPATPSGQQPNSVQLSSDGKTVSGSALSNDNGYLWTSAGGTQDIPTIAGTTSHNFPEAMTPDGSIVFGEAITASTSDVVFKYSSDVTTSLGSPDPGATVGSLVAAPQIMGVTANGSMLVGTEKIQVSSPPYGLPEGENYPWVWTPGGGFESLQTFLTANGVDIGDYVIDGISGISPDGNILYGSGQLGGPGTIVHTGWIVYLPEPGTALILLPLALALHRRRKGNHALPKNRWI
jgi:hypothetical protein